MDRCYSPTIKPYDFSPGNGCFVCANHFVDGQPTREYPNPTLFLSVLKNKFDKTPQKRRLLDKEPKYEIQGASNVSDVGETWSWKLPHSILDAQ
ncbi:uncharacterized protein LOC111336204 isoform X2 [Stylophora pistillata]|uniref:uncharacterized protein LOC111336204 isoform X2 n=1 Tax=Stylophora pistillata TaxID=50429 RepID=UPI000C04EC59|nr:uncharacterized protein LOC111336204 isoform X2 [Stylophora pistillata]